MSCGHTQTHNLSIKVYSFTDLVVGNISGNLIFNSVNGTIIEAVIIVASNFINNTYSIRGATVITSYNTG